MAASIWSAIVHTCHLPSWMCKIYGIAHSRTRIFNEYRAQELQPIRSIKKRNTVFLPYRSLYNIQISFTFSLSENYSIVREDTDFALLFWYIAFNRNWSKGEICVHIAKRHRKNWFVTKFSVSDARTHTNFLSIVLIIIIIVLVFVLPLCWGWNDVARHLMRNEFSNRNTGNTWAVSGGSAKKVHHRISERSIHWFNEKAGANYTTCAQ